ncbi:carbohydrate kinase family protein [Pseudobacteroides cellulosolvens]|uniref:PfkB domain protein n=1 Tax=Pseudobacteroides cellulosolvens ATCC 35603 = DSM 2933 TaxID=398512 RepID=A0A0L6JQG2_9FIRM|nr:carbohydrate kinase family protein [Pseudobacteroides cellulosolvens]KNY27925.1 PfkB domain protein [Pseudobacteroides cellulosolvens ATCC 35603 = DSM 2933]
MPTKILKKELDVYLYGMTVWSTLHLLDGLYPESDSYCEITESYNVPGGESGNSALVLAKFGLNVKLDGPFLGMKTKNNILQFYNKWGIDCTGLTYDSTYDGVEDMVLIDKNSRTVFGKFANYFRGPKRWNIPDRETIRRSKIVSIDPFFNEESTLASKFCVEEGKSYITIDCMPDSEIFKNAAAAIISNEFIKNNFPQEDIDSLFKRYTNMSKDLVIFTFGAQEILYGRKGSKVNRFIPYKVHVKSTLGAGDTFRAGVVYGIFKGWDDEKTVKFAAATAASVCTRFPLASNPPSLEEVTYLMNGGLSDIN